MVVLGLSADSKKRADDFINEVLETRVVYYLIEDKFNKAEISESNDYVDEDNNPLPVIPFWSKKFLPYARRWGESCQVAELSLEDFIEYWLKGMHNDGLIVGLNWDQHGLGYESPPIELVEKLTLVE